MPLSCATIGLRGVLSGLTPEPPIPFSSLVTLTANWPESLSGRVGLVGDWQLANKSAEAINASGLVIFIGTILIVRRMGCLGVKITAKGDAVVGIRFLCVGF